jgi:hypothetical protein
MDKKEEIIGKIEAKIEQRAQTRRVVAEEAAKVRLVAAEKAANELLEVAAESARLLITEAAMRAVTGQRRATTASR